METIHTNKAPYSNMPLAPYIRSAGYAVRKAPTRPQDRRILDYYMLVMQEGIAEAVLNGKTYAVREGDILLFQPNQLKSLISTQPLVCAFAHFDLFYNPLREMSFAVHEGTVDLEAYPHLMQPSLSEFGLDVPLLVHVAQPAKFRATFLHAVELWMSEDALQRVEANHLISELTIALFKQYSGWNARHSTIDQALDRIPAYLALHLSEPLPVQELAAAAHLSESRFHLLFRQRFGVSPHQYLIQLRLQHVKELLAETSLTLAEIAEQCGFTDLHHLSSSFKRREGMAPSEYRAQRSRA
ncbi:AraC family transcriptional regulator [Paenibacillus koleovorans]|uniref:AraC family transcriptional regulator n=1 Tax=Paenibacillus koleovorans TaxID=121608 RepID=UPI000FD91583|nr:AraC family transcriptional regulator [Paenibacillus koleovorans]